MESLLSQVVDIICGKCPVVGVEIIVVVVVLTV